MKKVLCVLLLLVLLVRPALAAEKPRLVDRAGLLTQEEAAQLTRLLDETSESWQLDVVVVTVSSLGGSSAMAYADDFFDYNGYGPGPGRDGILLLIAMEESEYWISTSGRGESIFTYDGLGYMEQQLLPYLSSGNFAGAFTCFARLCDDYLRRGGAPNDPAFLPKAEFDVLGSLGLSLAIGLGVALIVTGIMRSQLRSVRNQNAATDYVVPGSLALTQATDLYLYSHVSRTPIPKAESSGGGSHTSSSGRSHGGRGGKF